MLDCGKPCCRAADCTHIDVFRRKFTVFFNFFGNYPQKLLLVARGEVEKTHSTNVYALGINCSSAGTEGNLGAGAAYVDYSSVVIAERAQNAYFCLGFAAYYVYF